MLADVTKEEALDSILILEPQLTGSWAKSHAAQVGGLVKALDEGKAAAAQDPEAAKKLYITTSGLPPGCRCAHPDHRRRVRLQPGSADRRRRQEVDRPAQGPRDVQGQPGSDERGGRAVELMVWGTRRPASA
jgi:hypothetical protein